MAFREKEVIGMKTITAHATATITLHEDIEVEVEEDATEEAISQALENEAESVFREQIDLANGLEPHIEIEDIEIAS
jgi:DNA-binding protein